jgi:hypothetical protein
VSTGREAIVASTGMLEAPSSNTTPTAEAVGHRSFEPSVLIRDEAMANLH